MSATEPHEDSERVRSQVVSVELVELRRGQLTLDQYLEARVAEAVAHVEHLLSPDEFDVVRDIVRAALHTDPALLELVRRATGRDPHSRERSPTITTPQQV